MNRRKVNFVICFLAAIAIITPTYVSLENDLNESQNSSLSGPILAYYPTSYDFGYVEEGELYFTNFQIWNNGAETLSWNLTSSQTWIHASPMNGSSTGDHDVTSVSIILNTAGLSAGPHIGQIIINSNDDTSIHCFNVSFRINNPPNIPSKPSGPSSGVVGTYYSYSTNTIDPDGDNVRYGLDVNNDGIINHWSSSYYPSGVTYTINIQFNSAGTYYLRFKAKDVHGAESGFSPAKMVIISGENHAPEAPSVPIGPSTGTVGTSYSFTINTTDPDGDKIRYGWDWTGDDIIDEWTGFYESGVPVTLSHMYSLEGMYHIKVVAEDEHGAQSGFSPSKTIVITGNNPPNKPSIPTGPIYGRIGITYSYSSMAIDPDGDNLEYLFDWGDGTDSGWIGPYNSGDTVTVSHTWNTRGTFPIKVKARDIHEAESVWSDSLPVGMPKSREIFNGNYQFLDIYQTILDFIQSFKIN
jgi:hypothetical protein